MQQSPNVALSESVIAPKAQANDIQPDTAQNPIYTDAEIDRRLTKWQRRHMRLSNCFHEVAFAIADDTMLHPWKLIFYAIPFPPGAATAMLIGTLAYIAIGQTERLKNYRKDIRHSIMGPIHYERYKGYITEKILHKKGEEPGLKVQWAKFAQVQYFQSRKYMHLHAIEWMNASKDSWMNRQFKKSLNWDINRMKKTSQGHLFRDLPPLKMS